jgi:SHS2 domain-containing protein
MPKKRAQETARGHETIDHAADMGIRGWGPSVSEAFEEIAAAMFGLMADARGFAPAKTFPIACEANDLEGLLIEFLNALLARSDIEGVIPMSVAVRRLEEREAGHWALEAEGAGAGAEALAGRLMTEVKAATYYGVRVREIEHGIWEARCVVDL